MNISYLWKNGGNLFIYLFIFDIKKTNFFWLVGVCVFFHMHKDIVYDLDL